MTWRTKRMVGEGWCGVLASEEAAAAFKMRAKVPY